MARALKLLPVAALALLGAGAGVHLGWSAIGEINPVHFASSDGGGRFHADLAPNRSFDSPPSLLTPEQADSLAFGSSCVGCRTYPEEYHPAPDPAVEALYAPAQADVAPVRLAVHQEEPAEDRARRVEDLARVELYSRAPVTAEEQSAIAAPAPEEPLEPAS